MANAASTLIKTRAKARRSVGRAGAVVIAALVAFIVASAASWGHGLDPNRAILHLAGSTASLTAILPARAFPQCDKDSDAHLDKEEINACRVQILADVDAVLAVTDPQGRAGTRIFSDMNAAHIHGADHAAGSYLRFTLRYRWSEAPGALTVRYDRADLAPLTMVATRMTPERLIAERSPMEPSLALTLAPGHPEQTIWGSPEALEQAPQSSPTQPNTWGLAAVGLLALLGIGLLTASMLGERRQTTHTLRNV